MRAVLYTRVSSDRTDLGKSVEEQEAECRAYCRRQGWAVVRVFVDNDRSASRYARKDRPQYLALREFLTDGHADVLVMWEGSRAQRDLRDFLSLRDLCAERGIGYSYSGRLYDLTRTDDRFSTGLDALLAERESDVTRDRVLRSVRANAAAGRPHGKLLYGYRREYDDRGVFIRQVEHPEQAEVIREAARRIAAGEACNSVATDFNRRRIPAPRAGWDAVRVRRLLRTTGPEWAELRAEIGTRIKAGDELGRIATDLRTREVPVIGGQWDLTQVKRLVTNPSYAAQRVHRGQVTGTAAVWPAIIDEVTFANCQRFLSDPRRRTVRDTAVKHLLTGTATCGAPGCGSRLAVQKNRGSIAYLCRTGFHVSIKCDLLDRYVEAHVFEWMAMPDILDRLGMPDDQADAAAAAAKVEAVEKRARLDGFYRQAAGGKISPEGMAAIEGQLLPEIRAAERRSKTAHVPPILRELAGPNPAAVWGRFTIGQRREAVHLLMAVEVYSGRRGARKFDPARVGITPKF